MTLRSTRRVTRQAFGIVSAAAVLAACGGAEIVAILSIVTPLAGQWSNSTFDESISFLTPSPDEQVFQSKLNVTASVSSKSGVCGDTANAGVEVAGTLDNGKLSLHLPAASTACLEGSFVDLRRFDAAPLGASPARTYLNSRVDVRMNTGLWSSENGKVILKFGGPSSVDNNSSESANGCDVSTATKVTFVGNMQGFAPATLTRPTVPELRNDVPNAIMFTKVEFVDGATLKLLDATGQSLTLTRKADPANTLCP